jgi:hypothetical protein
MHTEERATETSSDSHSGKALARNNDIGYQIYAKEYCE